MTVKVNTDVKGWFRGVFGLQLVLHLAWKMCAEHATVILLKSNRRISQLTCLVAIAITLALGECSQASRY